MIFIVKSRARHIMLRDPGEKMAKGKRVRSQTKEVVCRVHDYFEELGKRSRVSAPVQRAADATGYSRASVKRFTRERRKSRDGSIPSPSKRYEKSRCLLVDDFDREAIRRRVYKCYEAKEHVTLTKLLNYLKKDGVFHGERTTLHRLLKEMGFK